MGPVSDDAAAPCFVPFLVRIGVCVAIAFLPGPTPYGRKDFSRISPSCKVLHLLHNRLGHLQNGGISIPFGMAPRFLDVFPSDLDFVTLPRMTLTTCISAGRCGMFLVDDFLMIYFVLPRCHVSGSRPHGEERRTFTHIHCGRMLQNTLLSGSGSSGGHYVCSCLVQWDLSRPGLQATPPPKKKDILHVYTRIAVQFLLRRGLCSDSKVSNWHCTYV